MSFPQYLVFILKEFVFMQDHFVSMTKFFFFVFEEISKKSILIWE